MAKKKSQQQKDAVKVVAEAVKVEKEEEEEDDDEEYEEDELELLQVDLGDMIKLKQILDEAVAAAVLEHIEEDYALDNIKLAIMVAACLFAVVAQFAPLPFPDSRFMLGLCCCCYFILSGVLQLITTFIDQDAILLTKPKETSKNKELKKYGIRVRSQFPRFSEYFAVVFEYQGLENSPYVEQQWSVGQFFDKEGFFDEIGLQLEIESLFKRLEDGKYDNDKAAAAEKKKNQ